ncbi:MAG: cytidine/deoxycytidylate deaminase family protein [Armatimonadota bacterium]|nr:cytidine/deoxycytidylate deaminase family protein [Armatimonadota bacterium]MDR5675923.1 cytidine/deoxycytidylate deaminase family protein [Armatimonadota bacterium]MDR5688981.1 cytidine/deoxycytidylate deaminase family protein [Armatimonadota bacterium]MDR7386434.1 cytidine/deoxycytidylate deaminase family protein [Armatimonadota bacterium]MDR7389267.1 cytidine/deoxycytidylate deaminase family protein [Armatimonadota bacterium]
MERPGWDEYFMSMAALAATRSTCTRRRVGAVVVKDRMVLSTGYNDTPRGLRNCGDGGCARCAGATPPGTGHDTCLCIHAEQNAIIQAAYHGVAIAGATLYSTYQPCLVCAKMIVNAGIRRVVYAGDYPDPMAARLLQEAGVELVRYTGPLQALAPAAFP